MASHEVTVNLGLLDRLVTEIQSFSDDVSHELDELEGRVAHLHTRWSGEGAAAHEKAHAEWTEGAQLMKDGIERLRTASAAAHAAFNATVQANRALFS